jgi:hypothetical protein
LVNPDKEIIKITRGGSHKDNFEESLSLCQLAIYERGFFSDLRFPNIIELHCKKCYRFSCLMSLTKLSLTGNNLTGKLVTFFYIVALWYSHR